MSVAPKRVVVVGSGIAGLTACDELRANGFDGELTIVGDETHRPYSRPALSKALLMDGSDRTSHSLPEPTHAATEIAGVRACSLDLDRRVVRLEDRTELPYEGLVIATGSRARRLGSAPVNGHSGEFTLRNLDDALALRARIAEKPSVLIVGGGPLGMEIASGCRAVGCEVTLVSGVQPLSAHLGGYLSEAFVRTARAQRLKLIVAGSARVAERAGVPVVVLSDDTTLEADVVVTAAGDLPNVDWLAGSGLLRNGRLEVDTRGRVRPDVVAVGDVAAFPTPQGVRRVPLWTSAIDQSRAAAAALLWGDRAPELDFRPYFWTEQFGLNLKACGHLPTVGEPTFVAGAEPTGPALMRWSGEEGPGTAVAINYRIPIPRLRRLASAPP